MHLYIMFIYISMLNKYSNSSNYSRTNMQTPMYIYIYIYIITYAYVYIQ